MKTQLEIAVAVAVLSLAGIARAAEYVDLAAPQQAAVQGAPLAGRDASTVVDDSARPTSHQLAEAQQQAVTGQGYTAVTRVPAGAPSATAPAPLFGIAEAQQLAVTGQGYGEPVAAPRRVARDFTSVRQ